MKICELCGPMINNEHEEWCMGKHRTTILFPINILIIFLICIYISFNYPNFFIKNF